MSLERGTGFDGHEHDGDRGPDDPARAATLRLIERHGAQVMRTARRYSVTAEDAEDAYQRAVEIMLTKAPDIPDAELLPWLKTVVKHEAFAIRRQESCSALGVDGGLDGASEAEASIAGPVPSPIEQTERFERLRLGAEAMRHLKPQEIRAMTLLAEGYSYRQICDETGWTYTKVNRCLAEGRRSFLERVAGIESGAECQRLEPKLSALADGEAGDEDVALLRRHLRRCSACRATLREEYLAPGVVGAFAPTALLGGAGRLWESLDGLLATVKIKTASLLRLPCFDAGSGSGHSALSSGSGRLISTGLAKGLALVAVGGAGAGGAALGVEELLDSTRPASASGSEKTSIEQRASGGPGSPDPRLVAERLRGAEREPRRHRGRNRSSTGSARSSDGVQSRAGSGESSSPRSSSPRPERPSTLTDSRAAGGDGRGRRAPTEAREESSSPDAAQDRFHDGACPTETSAPAMDATINRHDSDGMPVEEPAAIYPDERYGSGFKGPSSDYYGDGYRHESSGGGGAC